jgi:hypothetical protein
MKTFELSRQITAALDDQITYQKFLLWNRIGDESKILQEMILGNVKFLHPPSGEFRPISEAQYQRLPVQLVRQLNAWLAAELLVKATPDANDKNLATLPSGQRVRWRTALMGDQLAAEKWAAKQPHLLTAYVIERTFEFENDDGEFEQRLVEDILEMSLQDGYAMSELSTSEENSADFFEDFWGEASDNTSQDSSTTGSRSRKSRA